jgi:hypothetical protein
MVLHLLPTWHGEGLASFVITLILLLLTIQTSQMSVRKMRLSGV